MRRSYPDIPERMYLAGLSEGEAKVRQRRISVCITERDAPFKWLRMKISAERSGGMLPRARCETAVDAARFIVGAYPQIIDSYAERVAVLCLDTRLYPVAVYQAHVGGRAQSMVDMRNILLPAVMAATTTRFVVAHNHPTGDPSPSSDDRDVFDRIKRAAEAVGFRCDDFIVITDDKVSSLVSGDTQSWRNAT